MALNMTRRQFLISIGVALFALLLGVLSSRYLSQFGFSRDPVVTEVFKKEWFSPNQTKLDTQEWGGKVLILNFWATWCPPCVEEMPVLDQIQKEFGQQKLLIVGIGIDSPSNIGQFLEKTPISYPVALGGLEGSQIAKSLGNAQGGLPFTVVISPSGKIQGRKLGKISEDELRSFIKQAN